MTTKAIVTGHSRGIGAAIAAALIEQGVEVLGISRKAAEGLAIEAGDGLSQLAIDLADPAALIDGRLEQAMAAFLEGAERAVLVNNAGMVAPIGPVGGCGAVETLHAVTLNVAAPLIAADLFQKVAAGVADRRIVHISSGAGRRGMAGWGVYCATKAALDNHARAVHEDAIAGLRITSLAPGVVDTDMQGDIRASSKERFPAIEDFKAMKSEGALASADAVGSRIATYVLGDAFAHETVTDIRTL